MADEKRTLRDAIRDRQSDSGDSGGGQPAGSPQPDEAIWKKQISIGGPGLKHTTAFCRQLSTLLNVGISLQRALQILSERTAHPVLKDKVKDLSASIDSGSTLADALEKHEDTFGPMFINVVRVGEAGGILESSLARLTEVYESKLKLKRKVVSASIYPGIILLLVVFIITFIMVAVVPEFKGSLEESGVTAEGMTAVVFSISAVFQKIWKIMFVVIVGLLFIGYFYLKTAAGKRTMEGFLYLLPKIRNLPVNVALSRATRSLGSLVSAGIPLLEGLRVTADSSESYHMRNALLRVHSNLENGGKLEDPLRDEVTTFPPMIVDMLAVGEEAGALDTMLLNIADTCDAEVDATITALQSILEPMLIIIMAVIVLFVAISLFLPYFQLLDSMPG